MRHALTSFERMPAGGPAAGMTRVADTRALPCPRDRRAVGTGDAGSVYAPMTVIPASPFQLKAWANATHTAKGTRPRPLEVKGAWTG